VSKNQAGDMKDSMEEHLLINSPLDKKEDQTDDEQ
jgi:hypothetical protein